MASKACRLLLGALALTGCGPLVDDPANPPLRGKWQRELKVTSLVQDDIWIDRRDAPFQLPDDETTVQNCVEPTIRTADQINRTLLANGAADCRLDALDALDAKGAEVSGSGRCAPIERGGITLSGTIEVAGRQTADRATADVSLALVARTPSGLSRRIRAGFEAKWTRIGDCTL